MSILHTLLRCLLIVTFCLEGSVSLWTSSAMAVDNAYQIAAAGQGQLLAVDQDCAEEASPEKGGAVHDDCDCAQGIGCACACVFPAVVITHAIPFAAQHLLASVQVVPSRLPVVVAVTSPVFRPPIG